MSEADEDDIKIHKANVQKADSVEIYGPEGQHDLTFAARSCTAHQMEIFAQEFKSASYFVIELAFT